MYTPRFTITNEILKNVAVIEACREVITNAPLIPSYEKQFQDEITTATIHHATHIEGNDLSFEQVGEILGGKRPVVGEREAQEVINHRNVLRYLDQEVSGLSDTSRSVRYNESQILKIHSLVVERIVPEDQRGKYRRVQVVVRNAQTGEIVFRPPPAPEVPYLMENFISWLNSSEGREVHPVLRSGIVHYLIASAHPFTEGDGRTARAFATMVLFLEGYDIKKLFSLEEFFDKYAFEYYEALRNTDLTDETDFYKRDLTGWLEFFTRALSVQLNTVKEKVRRLSLDTKIKDKLGGKQLALNERQVKIMEYLESHREAIMKDFKSQLPMISEDTILREIYTLMKKKLIKKVGSRKAARYVLK